MKVLAIVRDVVVIVGVLVICGLMVSSERRIERERAVRLVNMERAIKQLEQGYQRAVFDTSDNKGIYHQMFRQNEISLEYMKLALLRDLLPVTAVETTESAASVRPPKLAH